MRSKIFLVALLLLITGAVVSPMRGMAQDTKKAAEDMPAEIVRLINEYRVGKGLTPLKSNYYITAAAIQHSRDMATQEVPFGHDGFDSRMAKLSKKVHPANAFGENVAEGPTSAKEVVDMWLGSEGHRKNIEGKYTLTGIGIVKGADGKNYFTQIFVYQSK